MQVLDSVRKQCQLLCLPWRIRTKGEERQRGDTMTRFEFIYICEGRTIDPALALENEAVREAIKKGPAAVADALDEEF